MVLGKSASPVTGGLGRGLCPCQSPAGSLVTGVGLGSALCRRGARTAVSALSPGGTRSRLCCHRGDSTRGLSLVTGGDSIQGLLSPGAEPLPVTGGLRVSCHRGRSDRGLPSPGGFGPGSSLCHPGLRSVCVSSEKPRARRLYPNTNRAHIFPVYPSVYGFNGSSSRGTGRAGKAQTRGCALHPPRASPPKQRGLRSPSRRIKPLWGS